VRLDLLGASLQHLAEARHDHREEACDDEEHRWSAKVRERELLARGRRALLGALVVRIVEEGRVALASELAQLDVAGDHRGESSLDLPVDRDGVRDDGDRLGEARLRVSTRDRVVRREGDGLVRSVRSKKAHMWHSRRRGTQRALVSHWESSPKRREARQ